MRKKSAMIAVLLALVLAVSPACAAGLANRLSGKCGKCSNTGVCTRCEGTGYCGSCYQHSGYSGPCVACKDAVPGLCRKCYGTGKYVSEVTYKLRTCTLCSNGKCKYCKGTGLSTVECGVCLTTGKCFECGGSGKCVDCQKLTKEERDLYTRLYSNLAGRSITIEDPEKWLDWVENECEVCLGIGSCESCGGDGYERCPRRCKPNSGCTACDGDGYKTCTSCRGSGRCSACGGDGQK